MADKDTSGIGMLRKLAEDVYDDWSLWSILKSGKKAEWGGDDGWPLVLECMSDLIPGDPEPMRVMEVVAMADGGDAS